MNPTISSTFCVIGYFSFSGSSVYARCLVRFGFSVEIFVPFLILIGIWVVGIVFTCLLNKEYEYMYGAVRVVPIWAFWKDLGLIVQTKERNFRLEMGEFF